MKSLEKTDEKNFENIIKTQDKLSLNLQNLAESIKNLAVEDKSGIFDRSYPQNPNIDSSNSN